MVFQFKCHSVFRECLGDELDAVHSSVEGTNAGFYFVVATNSVGAVTSSVASLTITNSTTIWFPTQTNGAGTPISNSPPFITRQPANQSAAPNETVAFTVGAIGQAPLFYQWYFSGAAIDATNNATATNATLTLTNVQAGGSLRVVVSNSINSVTSSVVFLIISNGLQNPGLRAAVEQTSEIRIVNVAVSSNGVVIGVNGDIRGKEFVLEYKDALDDPN
jgi:hypothetical protein